MSTKERRQLEKENRRELILQAAEKVMHAHGLYGLNIDLIAKETQLAKGTIYLYFKSKEEILGSLTLKARRLLLTKFEEVAQSPLPNIDKLKSIVKVNYDFYLSSPLFYDLFSFYEANTQVVETEEMYVVSKAISDVVVDIAQRAKAEGSLNPRIDPLHFTWCLYGMTVGVMQLIKVRGALMDDKMGISETDLLATFEEVIEHGLRA
jgi:TetR/AcrR family transcriptional regulator